MTEKSAIREDYWRRQIYSFNKYLSRTYYMMGTVLIKDTMISKVDMVSVLMALQYKKKDIHLDSYNKNSLYYKIT